MTSTPNASKGQAKAPSGLSLKVEASGRTAMGLVLLGLFLQLFAQLHFTPATFIIAAAAGVPLVVLGAGLFGWTVLKASRQMRNTDDGGPK